MSTETTEAPASDTTDKQRRRGGQRGERPWRDKPTVRERVMTQSLADYVKGETGKDVSPETVRAVRWCLPKWSNADSTKKLRTNMETKLEKARLVDKRQKALDMLREAESELKKYDSSGDLDEDEDEEDDDVAEYEDDSDDEDEDVFESGGKVTANFS
jgi:hypothetical protein